jgi:hypothetical protein
MVSGSEIGIDDEGPEGGGIDDDDDDDEEEEEEEELSVRLEGIEDTADLERLDDDELEGRGT